MDDDTGHESIISTPLEFGGRPIPIFLEEEITQGRLLGSGEFCNVFVVEDFPRKASCEINEQEKMDKNDTVEMSPEELLEQEFMRNNVIRKGTSRYAVKIAKKSSIDEYSNRYISNMVKNEIEILRNTNNHPNIIKMRAIVLCSKPEISGGNYIILDRLLCTLHDRIYEEWAQQVALEKKNTGVFTKMKKSKSRNKKSVMLRFVDQLLTASDITSAVKHLHNRSIVYRDLKPENIGFDFRGDTKLFDFGLSRELPLDDILPDGTYKLTAPCGSFPYMAPEVVLCEPYNQSSDIFCLALLIHEMLTLKEPFKNMDPAKYLKKVVDKGETLALKKDWPIQLKSVLTSCWSLQTRDRPPPRYVMNTLRSVASSRQMLAFGSSDGDSDLSRSQSLMNSSIQSLARG